MYHNFVYLSVNHIGVPIQSSFGANSRIKSMVCLKYQNLEQVVKTFRYVQMRVANQLNQMLPWRLAIVQIFCVWVLTRDTGEHLWSLPRIINILLKMGQFQPAVDLLGKKRIKSFNKEMEKYILQTIIENHYYSNNCHMEIIFFVDYSVTLQNNQKESIPLLFVIFSLPSNSSCTCLSHLVSS